MSRKKDELSPEMEAAVKAATADIHLEATVDAATDEAMASYAPEPGAGECLLVKKDGTQTIAPLDAPERAISVNEVRYERTGETAGGRPIYTEPQT